MGNEPRDSVAIPVLSRCRIAGMMPPDVPLGPTHRETPAPSPQLARCTRQPRRRVPAGLRLENVPSRAAMLGHDGLIGYHWAPVRFVGRPALTRFLRPDPVDLWVRLV